MGTQGTTVRHIENVSPRTGWITEAYEAHYVCGTEVEKLNLSEI